MSYEEARALREIEHALRRAEQDRQFYRNEMILQKLSGVCILIICFVLFEIMTKLIQAPAITTGALLFPVIALGISLIFTKTNLNRLEETN